MATVGPMNILNPDSGIVDGVGDYYATAALVSPGVVVSAWSRGNNEDTVEFEARAVRWTADLQGEVGPLFRGPAIPPGTYGTYQSRLMGVMRIAEDVALVIPGDSASDASTVGWKIHVNATTLAITFLGIVHWPGPYNNDDYGCRVPGNGRSGLGIVITPTDATPLSYGFVSFNDAGAVQNMATYGYGNGPLNNSCAIVDLDDKFLVMAKMPEDWVPAQGTVGRLGYRPAYYMLSFWLVDAVSGVPANTGTKVMMIDDVADPDGIYATRLPNGHIHVLFDCWSKYLYTGDPNTSRSRIIDINPNTWTYTEGPNQPYVANGTSGGLQDYANIEVVRDNMSVFCLWSYNTNGFPAADGLGGLRVGTFDGKNVKATLIYSWEQVDYRISCEIIPTGGSGFILFVNADLSATEQWGKVWALCGTIQEQGEIDGAMDLNRASFW